MLVVDRARVDRINDVDEAITFATLAAFKPVVEGEMIATVKIIPFGVEATLRDAAVAAASGGGLRVAPYVIKRVGIVSTLLPGLGAEGGGENAAGHRRAAGARPVLPSWPSAACRMTRRSWRRRSGNCSGSAPSSSSCSALPPSPTAAT